MENNHNKDTAQNADPQDNWQNAETEKAPLADPRQYSGADGDAIARTNEEVDERLYATANNPDEDEDEEEEKDDDAAGDWGHVDPAESNGPFPDPNAPSAPGSAV